jgi:hypothetical protein
MYLILELSSAPEQSGQLDALEFRDDAAALEALAALRDGMSENVSIRNEEGTLWCIRRSAIRSAWVSNEMPHADDTSLPRTPALQKQTLLERLGKPIYEGPDGSVSLQTRDEPVQAGPAKARLMVWRCPDVIDGRQPCVARNDGMSDQWFYRACNMHRN